MLLKTLESKFNNNIFVKRYAALVVVLYYCLFRLETYTWKFSDLSLVWPAPYLKIDSVFLNQHIIALLIIWLISFFSYWKFLGTKSASLFYFIAYLFVGRLNSYFSIERVDFFIMTSLLLSLLIPKDQGKDDKKLFSSIVFIWQLTWVGLFFSAGLDKLRSAGFLWADPEVLKGFIFRENYFQGPSICDQVMKVSLINTILFSNFWLKFLSVSTLFLELLYPVLFFCRRLIPLFLIVTLIFQLNVKFILNTSFFNYWFFVFIWFYSFKEQRFSLSFKKVPADFL